MKGGRRKTRKTKTPTKNDTSTSASSPVTEESNIVSQSPECSTPSTPKRTRTCREKREDIYLTSTPVHKTTAEAKAELQTDSSPEPRCLRKRASKEQTQRSSQTKATQAKCRSGRKQEVNTEMPQRDIPSPLTERCRPRFELTWPDTEEQDETLQSSDLSIELSHHEELWPSLSFQDEEEEESEDDELPIVLMQKDKKPIKEGAFVWHKMRNYPHWPALVKRVNPKQKKASILFIADPMIHTTKGFSVGLKNLKPYDCEESDQFMCEAIEKYRSAIQWATDLITDYRIRIACGSFSGSFMEYFAHDMSFPVRKNYPNADSEKLTITSDSLIEEPWDDSEEDSVKEQQKVSRSSKRLLPDRTQAAHNRANEKLVHFIVKQRLGEDHLLAVIRRKQQSRWLSSFLSAKRRYGVNTYLEDEQQLDQVFRYLKILFEKEKASASGLAEGKQVECVSFVLEVLLPEAIICAIAGVENVSFQKAEQKYLKGRRVSNREKEAFDEMIDQQTKKKTQHQITGLAVF